MSDLTLELDKCLAKLNRAVAGGASDKYCLRLWSSFVRLRDEGKCVVCGSSEKPTAHHIFRKSFLTWARYETGNGITLCRACHREPHEEFNRKPDPQQPVDAQGGENIDLSIYYLGQLLRSARERDLLNDCFYYVSDGTLIMLKRFQGIRDDLVFPGCRLEQADLIWRQTPRQYMRALMRANGFDMPDDLIQKGSLMGFFITQDGKFHDI